jgi:hypothetical protein
MFENLNQSYHFNNNFKHNLRTIVLVSMAFMLLLLYFQPFGINFMTSTNDGYFVLAIGIISAAVLFMSTLIVPGLFPGLFDTNRWTIKKELIWNVCMFGTLVFGFTMTALIFNHESLVSLTVFRSGALALLPLILFNLLNYNHSLKTKVSKAIESGRHWLNDESKTEDETTHQKVQIESENGKELFDKNLKDLILIQSANNYVEIFYREGDKIRRQILRQTLQTVEIQLAKFVIIKKCHRRCLVNLDQVTRISGLASNYTLEVKGLDFGIPISRQKVTEFRKLLSR